MTYTKTDNISAQ